MGLSRNSENPDKATPFSLVYGCEAILPLEIQISSLRIALTTEMKDKEKYWLRLHELEALDDKRLQAQQIKLYQAQIFRAFNKKVKDRTFKKASWLSRGQWWWRIKRKENFNPNGKERLW